MIGASDSLRIMAPRPPPLRPGIITSRTMMLGRSRRTVLVTPNGEFNATTHTPFARKCAAVFSSVCGLSSTSRTQGHPLSGGCDINGSCSPQKGFALQVFAPLTGVVVTFLKHVELNFKDLGRPRCVPVQGGGAGGAGVRGRRGDASGLQLAGGLASIFARHVSGNLSIQPPPLQRWAP